LTTCFFATDLHGQVRRYRKLFERIAEEKPKAVFLGGDLLPHSLARMSESERAGDDFMTDVMVEPLAKIREQLADDCPRVFLILGNDDARSEEAAILDAADRGIWQYLHERRESLGEYSVYGYACVPPTPFLLKDWERYDVSRHVDPGCVPPTEGWRTVPVPRNEIEYGTIAQDIERLVGDDILERNLFLFHSPPYQSKLDRAALDGMMVDHVPLDVHIGSIAIQRFIEARQPAISLHGHVHESARLTGSWKDRIGKTWCFSAAHDGPELALVRFDLEQPEKAARELI